MKIGIGIPNQVRNVRASVIPQWASRAEQAGFSSLSTVGRPAYPGVDDVVALAAAAGATSTIGLFSGVLLTTVWPATLLAKVVAGVDGVSGERLTLGIGIGNRQDDFLVDGRPMSGLGKRLDEDLETFRRVWDGEFVGGGVNAAVPNGTRQVPLMFGGLAPAALQRMARWGTGYVGPSFPVSMVEPIFDRARAAWLEAGRPGQPRLIALVYFSLAEPDRGRANVRDYYSVAGDSIADMVAENVATTPSDVHSAIKAWDAAGVDELFFNPGTDQLDEVARLAELLP